MIKEVRAWFLNCPLLKESALFSTDKIGADPTEYEVAALPCEPILQKYVDGGSKRAFRFAFASREQYDEENNPINAEFYEKLLAWVEEQERNRNLPVLSEGQYPQQIRIISNGYVYDSEDSTAIYQMEMELIYIQKAGY